MRSNARANRKARVAEMHSRRLSRFLEEYESGH